MAAVEWAVWYDDGSSFSNLDGPPESAPRWGVMCVAAQSGDHGRMIWHGVDYYAWKDGAWVSLDITGLFDYLGNHPGKEKIVLIGRHVAPDVFYRIYQMAVDDPRLPPKSSIDPIEQRQRRG